MPRPRFPVWTLPILLLAIATFLSAQAVGFLSDDFLMVRYWDRAAASVRWGNVGMDFEGPWFGAVRDMYRPIVTLSYAVQLLFGADPRWFHCGNAAMQLVAALAVGAIVRLRFPQAPWYLPAFGGAVLLLHPAAVEPSHWIAARTTGLEVMFSALAMALYAGFLYGRLPSRWPAFVAMALALGSKEGAMTLAVSMTAIDLLCTRGSARARYMGLRPFWILLFGYLLFRKVTLGVFTTAKESLTVGEVLHGYLVHGSWLLGPPGSVVAWLCTGLFVVGGVVLGRRAPRRLLLYGGWIALLLVPTSVVPLAGEAWDGRLVYHALPAVALLLVEVLVLLSGWSGRAPWLLGLPVLWVLGALPVMGGYRHGGAAVQSFRAGLVTAGAAAAPGRPAAAVAFSLTQPDHAVQLLQRKAWGLMTHRPFVPKDLPVCSLESVLPDFGVGPPRVDGAPAHAVLAAGGALLTWSDGRARSFRRPTAAAPAALQASASEPGRFTAPTPWLPFSASVVQVELPAPAQRCELRFDGALPGLEAAARSATAARPAARFCFDVGDATAALVLMNFDAPWPDVWITVDGRPAPAGTRVLLRGPDALPIAAPLRGRALALDDIERELAPPAPGAQLYLLLPLTTVRGDDGRTGERLVLSADARHELGFLQGLLPGALVHYFWRVGDAAGAAPPRWSELDWFALR